MADSTVPAWLEREVARGLQGLVALRLVGAPAEDSITLTLDVWLAALSARSLQWVEHLDAPRLRRGFMELYRICDHWPPPKLLMDHLGNRDPPAASLPPPRPTEEERARNLERGRAIKQRLMESLLQRGKETDKT